MHLPILHVFQFNPDFNLYALLHTVLQKSALKPICFHSRFISQYGINYMYVFVYFF